MRLEGYRQPQNRTLLNQGLLTNSLSTELPGSGSCFPERHLPTHRYANFFLSRRPAFDTLFLHKPNWLLHKRFACFSSSESGYIRALVRCEEAYS